MSKRISWLLPYLMWGCAVSFYLYQYTVRVAPSIIMEDLMRTFHISAHGFATLSAVAMYCYGLMQVPIGMLADIFGARRILLWSMVTCVSGITFFTLAQDLTMAYIGRILIGLGSASAFLSVNKIGASWFPPNRRAMVFAMTMTAGTIGALNGGAPLAHFIHLYGWRYVLLGLSGIGCLIFIVNVIFLRAAPSRAIAEPNNKAKEILKLTWQAIKSKQVLIAALAAFGAYIAISVLADLWGVSYLMQAQNITKAKAAQACSLLYVGLCVGSLTISWISDRLQRRKLFVVVPLFLLSLALVAFFYLSALPLPVVYGLLFFIGFCCGAEMICFALSCESVSPLVTGTVTGFINAVVTLGGAFLQEQVGRILDHVWCGQCTAEGLRFYSKTEYQTALSIIIIAIFLSGVFACFLTENKKK